MKAILTFSAACLLLTTGCGDKDNNSNNNVAPSNTWKVGSTTYTATTVRRDTTGGEFGITALTTGSNASSIGFSFMSTPAAGTYKVSIGANSPNQVAVTVTTTDGGSFRAYGSTGTDNVNATVSITNGKYVITLPDASAKIIGGNDSLKVSANAITEQ